MTLPILLLSLIFAMGTLSFVLYPLYRRQGSPALLPSNDGSPLGTSDQEQAARAALHEIELDYQLGNLAEADYSSLRERYMQRALLAFKDRREREQELDTEIEEQLRQMKENDDSETKD